MVPAPGGKGAAGAEPPRQIPGPKSPQAVTEQRPGDRQPPQAPRYEPEGTEVRAAPLRGWNPQTPQVKRESPVPKSPLPTSAPARAPAPPPPRAHSPSLGARGLPESGLRLPPPVQITGTEVAAHPPNTSAGEPPRPSAHLRILRGPRLPGALPHPPAPATPLIGQFSRLRPPRS